MESGKELLLKDLIYNFVHKNGKQQLFSERVVMQRWPEYVGEMCAQHSTCVSFKKGVLKVKVTNAALRFELAGRKSLIMERINADYTIPVVNNIIFC